MMRKDDIRRDLPASATSTQSTLSDGPRAALWLTIALRVLAAMAFAVVSLTLAYQLPVTHAVNIGGYDAAYVQGFYEPEQASAPALHGSDGSARWTHATTDLLFPQAGTPAQVTLHWRAATGRTTDVQVLLNGTTELGTVPVRDSWQEHTFTINAGLLKPNDVVIELRSATAPVSSDDARPVGVLLDRASYRVGPAPITPYPAQLAYGALAAALLALLFRRPTTDDRRPNATQFSGSWFLVLGSWFLVLGSWFFLYRSQPLYPYPLRNLLPALDLVLAAVLALRYGPTLTQRTPALLDALALGGIAVWLVALLRTAQRHTVLSLPGVENDFRVFALRSAHLFGTFQPSGSYDTTSDGVLRADGFYNLLYPLLLWLVRPLCHDNPFLAAQWIAAGSAALVLGVTWWLARSWLGHGAALVALCVIAFSPLFVQYALYIGTDMPFAALCTLALALLLKGQESGVRDQGSELHTVSLSPRRFVIPTGVAVGAAFLVRHPGILLLPVGWLAISFEFSVLSSQLQTNEHLPKTQNSKLKIQNLLLFTIAFLVTVSPQVIINTVQTGNPLFNEQAKNIWLGVYAGGDWNRWAEAPDSISFAQVIGQDPARVFTHWWTNVRNFTGAGGEQTSEFERAIQLRLLGFPANWLAVAGLLGWIVAAVNGKRQNAKAKNQQSSPFSFRPFLLSLEPWPFTLVCWLALYIASVSAAFALPRFALPVVPVYALAAAWTLSWVRGHGSGVRDARASSFVLGLLSLVLFALLWGGFANGANDVLDNQATNEVAAVQLVQARLQPDERLIVCGKDAQQWCGYTTLKYSALTERIVNAPKNNDRAALRASGARYVLTANAVAPQGATKITNSGTYTLYRLTQ